MIDADDRQLLLATHAGDEPAARALWARHAPHLIAYAATILPAGLSGEDIVQTAMCSVLSQNRRTLARVENVAAWLAHLVRNTALNSIRSARRGRARVKAAGELTAPIGRSPPAASTESEDGLKAAVDALPRRLREAVALRHVAGLTFDQMALALDANRNTVAARYRAALATLRGVMADGGISDPMKRGASAVEVLHG